MVETCILTVTFSACLMFNGCTQAGLLQIVEDQQKMILHLEAELRKTAMMNSTLESTKVFVNI